MFPEADIETIKDIWRSCNKNKTALIEMLMQMMNPELANDEDLQNANALADQQAQIRAQENMQRQRQQVNQDREAQMLQAQQAQMLQEFAGIADGGDHGAMTEQELKDLQMAQAMQQ